MESENDRKLSVLQIQSCLKIKHLKSKPNLDGDRLLASGQIFADDSLDELVLPVLHDVVDGQSELQPEQPRVKTSNQVYVFSNRRRTLSVPNLKRWRFQTIFCH